MPGEDYLNSINGGGRCLPLWMASITYLVEILGCVSAEGDPGSEIRSSSCPPIPNEEAVRPELLALAALASPPRWTVPPATVNLLLGVILLGFYYTRIEKEMSFESRPCRVALSNK